MNPEGHIGADGKPNPDPKQSVKDIREAFKRMDHNDTDTVALIGGGHAFGKTHGACPDGPGYPPNVIFNNPAGRMPDQIPWAGNCGDGKGPNAFTSGFEGPWTTNPLQWDNEFFKDLLGQEWEVHTGPGGHHQWRMKDPPDDAAKKLMRLTSDMALLEDEKYKAIVQQFAADIDAFAAAFDDAWTKLTTKGGRWSDLRFCDGDGIFPEHLLDHHGMKSTDLVV